MSKLKKPFSQIVGGIEPVSQPTPGEIENAESKFKFPCSFAEAGYTARFKTNFTMQEHRCRYMFNYGITKKAFEVEEVRAVYGRDTRKLTPLKRIGYAEEYPKARLCQLEHLLLRDECKPTLDNFWLSSGINPS